jgi:hypothetical protein
MSNCVTDDGTVHFHIVAHLTAVLFLPRERFGAAEIGRLHKESRLDSSPHKQL